VGKIVIPETKSLYFECGINKNALLETGFWRFFLLGQSRLDVLKIAF